MLKRLFRLLFGEECQNSPCATAQGYGKPVPPSKPQDDQIESTVGEVGSKNILEVHVYVHEFTVKIDSSSESRVKQSGDGCTGQKVSSLPASDDEIFDRLKEKIGTKITVPEVKFGHETSE